jgi:uncharacterized protein YjiS (DUF1127 family)
MDERKEVSMNRMLATSDTAFERYQGVAALPGLVGRIAARLSCWRDRIRGRRQLAGLDARALADIGITRLDAARECAKPFWRG